jgi:hypothetical protein
MSWDPGAQELHIPEQAPQVLMYTAFLIAIIIDLCYNAVREYPRLRAAGHFLVTIGGLGGVGIFWRPCGALQSRPL